MNLTAPPTSLLETDTTECLHFIWNLYLHPLVKMEFANKRQLHTFVIYERACNLLFSTNDLLVYASLYIVFLYIFAKKKISVLLQIV